MANQRFSGARLRAVRASKGLTQAQLAGKIGTAGIHAQELSRYESGATVPGVDRALEIAAALEVALEALLVRKRAPRQARL